MAVRSIPLGLMIEIVFLYPHCFYLRLINYVFIHSFFFVKKKHLKISRRKGIFTSCENKSNNKDNHKSKTVSTPPTIPPTTKTCPLGE